MPWPENNKANDILTENVYSSSSPTWPPQRMPVESRIDALFGVCNAEWSAGKRRVTRGMHHAKWSGLSTPMTDLLYCAISGLFTAGGCPATARMTVCVCEFHANQNKMGMLIQELSLMRGSEGWSVRSLPRHKTGENISTLAVYLFRERQLMFIISFGIDFC